MYQAFAVPITLQTRLCPYNIYVYFYGACGWPLGCNKRQQRDLENKSEAERYSTEHVLCHWPGILMPWHSVTNVTLVRPFSFSSIELFFNSYWPAKRSTQKKMRFFFYWKLLIRQDTHRTHIVFMSRAQQAPYIQDGSLFFPTLFIIFCLFVSSFSLVYTSLYSSLFFLRHFYTHLLPCLPFIKKRWSSGEYPASSIYIEKTAHAPYLYKRGTLTCAYMCISPSDIYLRSSFFPFFFLSLAGCYVRIEKMMVYIDT